MSSRLLLRPTWPLMQWVQGTYILECWNVHKASWRYAKQTHICRSAVISDISSIFNLAAIVVGGGTQFEALVSLKPSERQSASIFNPFRSPIALPAPPNYCWKASSITKRHEAVDKEWKRGLLHVQQQQQQGTTRPVKRLLLSFSYDSHLSPVRAFNCVTRHNTKQRASSK
jgi:hypothetical protein